MDLGRLFIDGWKETSAPHPAPSGIEWAWYERGPGEAFTVFAEKRAEDGRRYRFRYGVGRDFANDPRCPVMFAHQFEHDVQQEREIIDGNPDADDVIDARET